jgi:glycogen debranching enzyme
VSSERYTMVESRKSRLTIKEGELFLVSDMHGEMDGREGSPFGLWALDTRFLSRFEMTMNGRPCIVLAWTAERGYAATMEYTNLELRPGGRTRIPQATIHLRRTRFIADRVYDRLRVRNFGAHPVELTFEYLFEADFCDIFEVRGERRRSERASTSLEWEGPRLVFTNDGRDGQRRRTIVELDRPPDSADGGRVRFVLRLEPRERAILRFSVALEAPGLAPAAAGEFNLKLGGVRRAHERWYSECTELLVDNEQFGALLRRGQRDLGILLGDSAWGRLPMGGLPWFGAPFGRDLALVGLQTLVLDPRLARNAGEALSQLQGRETDEVRLEQPGRILHELRRGQMAHLHEIPHSPSYMSVDSTALFLILLCGDVAWSGDLESFELHRDAVLAALTWIDAYGDLDGDGFVEYAVRTPAGTLHQGWRNAPSAIVHPDGAAVEGPVALAEVQGYVYMAKRELAQVFGQLGDVERSEQLQSEAAALRGRFNEAFWLPDEQYLAMALDGGKRPVHTVTSTAGSCLFSGIVDDEHVPSIVKRLLSPDMFSGWGVRTMSRTCPQYNPVSLYNGGIWPFDNAMIVFALKRLGYVQESLRVARSMVEVARFFPDMRLPELFCGFTRQTMNRPVWFPMACSPSATAAGALFQVLQSMLGLYPAADENILYVQNPALPKWLGEVTVANLHVGRSVVSLRFRREGNQTVLSVRDKRGPVRVVVVE